MSYHFCGVILATEGIQKAVSETMFLLVGAEHLDRGSLAACKKIEVCKVCGKACHFWKILNSFFLGFDTDPSYMK